MQKEATLGERAKAFRLDRQWTQAQMAAYLGVSRRLVNQLENGYENVADLTRAKIEKQLKAVQSAVA
jgi:transcriptional regulator with XRE-family HTH domain